MKIIKQNKLLSSLLTSDIIYFKTNSVKKKNSNFFLNKIEIKQKNHYILLNVIVLLQSIKQVIRLLQFNLKYYKNFLQVVTSNNLYNQIIDYTSKAYGVKDSKISTRLKLDTKLNSKVIAFIGEDTSTNLKYLIHKAFNNNINSIVLINSYLHKNLFGNYKVFANINSYKKVLFLMVVMLLAQKSNEIKQDSFISLKKN